MIYRLPGCDADEFNTTFEPIVQKLNSENKKAILIGVFNLDLLRYDVHDPTNTFVNNMISYLFFLTINNPTHIRETIATLINNILINCMYCDYISNILYSDISNHLYCNQHASYYY